MARYTPRVTSRRQQPTTRARTQGSAWTRGYVDMKGGYKPPRAVTGVPAAAGGGAVPGSAIGAPAYSLSNLPVDADYNKAVELLGKQRSEQLAAIAGERVRTLGDYGFTEGPGGTLAFDPNNPFSKASLLKKTYDTNRRSTAQSMGASGQLYSGAFQNAQDLIGRNQLQAEDAQQKALLAFLARNTGQTKEANTGYELAVGEQDAARAERFRSNPNYDPASGTWKDPAAPVSGPASAAAGAAAPKTTKVAVSSKLGGRWLYEKRGNSWVPIRRMF